MKRKTKPKPATAGEKIVGIYRATLVTTREESDARHANIARRIDRAIARAVQKERAKCDAEWRAYIVKMRKDGEP